MPEYAHHVYYCDPEGNDATADGSLEKPFASLQKAVDLVVPGDTIYMNAGTYHYDARVNISAVGEPNSGRIAPAAFSFCPHQCKVFQQTSPHVPIWIFQRLWVSLTAN